MGRPANDMLGQRFGILTVVARVGHDQHANVLWRCQCDCGEVTILSRYRLLQRKRNHCGCMAGKLGRRRPPPAKFPAALDKLLYQHKPPA